MEVSKREYNYTFGILSALGIIFVVLGHVNCNLLTIDGWFTYYSFHMPLFIFISGYFFNRNSVNHIGKYLWKKVKRLLVPFFLWAFIYQVIHTIMDVCWGFTLGHSFSFYNWLVRPWVDDQPIGFNVASWFLIALFLLEVFNAVVTFLLNKMKIQNEIIPLVLSLVVSLFAIRCIQWGTIGFVKIICRSLYLWFFYRLGQWYRVSGEKYDTFNSVMYFLFYIS